MLIKHNQFHCNLSQLVVGVSTFLTQPPSVFYIHIQTLVWLSIMTEHSKRTNTNPAIKLEKLEVGTGRQLVVMVDPVYNSTPNVQETVYTLITGRLQTYTAGQQLTTSCICTIIILAL